MKVNGKYKARVAYGVMTYQISPVVLSTYAWVVSIVLYANSENRILSSVQLVSKVISITQQNQSQVPLSPLARVSFIIKRSNVSCEDANILE